MPNESDLRKLSLSLSFSLSSPILPRPLSQLTKKKPFSLTPLSGLPLFFWEISLFLIRISQDTHRRAKQPSQKVITASPNQSSFFAHHLEPMLKPRLRLMWLNYTTSNHHCITSFTATTTTAPIAMLPSYSFIDHSTIPLNQNNTALNDQWRCGEPDQTYIITY